jgi:NAD(P)-dependent dehydrogenase (short-subunit alcohol dehydrogenase family)
MLYSSYVFIPIVILNLDVKIFDISIVSMSSTEQRRLILVTGANRGIGFLVVKKLAEESSYNSAIILLGCRDFKRGEDALIQLNSPSNVHVLQLDTSSRESIIRAVDEIKQKYGAQLDIVINNAAISTTEITVSAARELFNTNYYGIKLLNEHLVPLMQQNGGRIVNVSSRVGSIVLQEASRVLQEKYTSSTLTNDELDQLVEDFIAAIETNSLQRHGYNPKLDFLVYGVTKTALNALTQVEARQWSSIKNLVVVSVTPGLCATDMARHIPNARPPELGADSILYVVNASQNELENGGFYRDGQQLPLINEPILKD